MKLLFCLGLSTILFTMLSWTRIISSSPCQVYPSEYAYHDDSVNRAESASANCRQYPSGLLAGGFSNEYIRCNGTQLTLTDSNLGSEQYSSSKYYWWPAMRDGQLLFIFPTRVSLITITLHYYSDSVRGLPRLRFYAVPDDLDVWDVPSVGIPHVDIASVPPGGESAGRKNVSINVNFNTKKVLVYKFSSDFQFAVSEVEFFSCTTTTTSVTSTVQTTARPFTVENDRTTISQAISTPNRDTEATTPVMREKPITDAIVARTMPCDSSVSPSEVVAWVLVSILTVLFTGLLSVNMIILWLYKKRQDRDMEGRERKYEMEGNPCYEPTAVKQTTDTHLYEPVRGGGAN